MKCIVVLYSSISLVLRIVIGLLLGTLLALVLPDLGWLPVFGTLFTGSLKAVAPLLVFFLVIASLCRSKGMGNMRTVVCLYLVSTVVAALLAVVASYLFPSTLVLEEVRPESISAAPKAVGVIVSGLLIDALGNPVSAIANAKYLSLLFWAILIGVALRKADDGTKKAMDDVAHALTTVVG